MKKHFSALLAALTLSAPFAPQAFAEEKTPLPASNSDSQLAAPLRSPNGRIAWKPVFHADGRINGFEVLCGDVRALLVSDFGIRTSDGAGANLKAKGADAPRRIEERYRMPTGKRSECGNRGYEKIYSFVDDSGREQRLVVRAYDDGIAFRYELSGLKDAKIAEERTTYRIPEGVRRWMMPWSEGYEDFFPLSTTGEGKTRRWGYPSLIQAANDVWVLISESGIERVHSASSLRNDRAATDYRVAPDRNDLTTTGEWSSPWRVLIVGSKADVVESTLVNDVAPACRLDDVSWIRPGGASWIYWAHNHGSKDFQIVKSYIDMAAKLKLPYVLIDWEWDVMGNGGTMEDALRYAKERGVRVLLWYNSSTAWLAAGPLHRLNAPENREKEFSRLEKLGVAGVKIDFFQGDLQTTMAYCIDLLESAAKHKLMVNFHGATVPRGWARTYPNLMSTEGVYGAEWYNNNARLTEPASRHNVTLCFTRNVVGSMDYTPCTFSDSQHPHITTHAHELALPVLFESGIQHWADRPESYYAQPERVQRFLGELPAAWDETKFLSGEPDEEIVLARRKGGVWFVAGLNGTAKERRISVDWSALGEGEWNVELFEDGDSKESPWKLSSFNPSDPLPRVLTLKPRGGFVAVVKPNRR